MKNKKTTYLDDTTVHQIKGKPYHIYKRIQLLPSPNMEGGSRGQ